MCRILDLVTSLLAPDLGGSHARHLYYFSYSCVRTAGTKTWFVFSPLCTGGTTRSAISYLDNVAAHFGNIWCSCLHFEPISFLQHSSLSSRLWGQPCASSAWRGQDGISSKWHKLLQQPAGASRGRHGLPGDHSYSLRLRADFIAPFSLKPFSQARDKCPPSRYFLLWLICSPLLLVVPGSTYTVPSGHVL